MRQIGYKNIFLLILLIIIYSCKYNAQLLRSNEFKTGYFNIYKNQKINLIIPFYGDYYFQNPKWNVQIRSTILSKYPHLKKIWKNRITNIISAKTTTSPYFNCFGFLLEKQDYINYKNYEFEDFKTTILKGNTIIDDEFVTQNWIIKLDSYDLFLFTYANIKENAEDHTKESLATAINNEFDSIMDEVINTFEKGDQLQDPFQLASEKFYSQQNGNFFSTIEVLEKNENEYLNSKIFYEPYIQAISTYLSIVGNKNLKDKFLLDWPYYNYTKELVPDSSEYNFNTDDSFLKKKLLENQVIMFNEAHYNPIHRLRVNELLPFLRQNGFNYLALEALNESSRETQRRGFPNFKSGFYTNEYHLANLIRRAISLGFTLINYDTETDKNREFIQAKNLYNHSIKFNKDAKLVVLSGFDHIFENNKSKKYMADFFSKISGINPLTINQTKFNESKTNSILDSAKLIILTDKYETKTNDLYLINNRMNSNIVLIGDQPLQTITLRLDSLDDHFENDNLLQLFPETEFLIDESTSPCFSYFGDERSIKLSIPDGRYILKFQNKNFKTLKILKVDQFEYSIIENK